MLSDRIEAGAYAGVMVCLTGVYYSRLLDMRGRV